ncbi:MAG: hypothetical protein EA397_02250 [Deltaproteobacteria bacterium]|nr:MAG: hypothetical protein EA397_02250 [Deltaproteobacteria bacterium]
MIALPPPERIRWTRHSLPLRRPFRTGAHTTTAREVLLLQIDRRLDGQLIRGFGEAAPLPGWSKEGLDEVVAHLEGKTGAAPPSLAFGLELAALDALARHRAVPLYQLLGELLGTRPHEPPTLALQAPIPLASPRATADAARDSVQRGFHTLKLKLSGRLLEDQARVEAVRAACPDALLRLDANGSYLPDDARRLLKGLEGLGIDLFEEPVPADLADAHAMLRAGSRIPLAADERCSPPERGLALIEGDQIDAVVLKPSSLGGLLPAARLAHAAAARGIRVVLSTLLDGAVGRHGIAHLGVALGLAGPHGLGTGGLFSRDLCRLPDRIEQGVLHLHPGPGLGFEPEGLP